jgi:GNAT superfamily N-acetyltransferase
LTLDDVSAAAALHIETWLDTYRGIIPDSKLDALNQKDFESNWIRILTQSDPKWCLLSLGAFDKGELLGIAGAGKPRENWGYDSELWAVNVPRRFQKRGAGKALVRDCVGHALSLGAHAMYLYCAVGNENAMQFYRYLGARASDRIVPREGYQEQAMVWDDLKALARRLT